MQNLPQLQNINIIKSKDTNNEKKKESTGTSSTSDEVEKADEDQMVDEQLHEDKIALCAYVFACSVSNLNNLGV